jgi:probable phosphoglycerate mutase
MSTILLIRHGESESNAGLPTSDSKAIKLTSLGLKQAQWIADEIQESHLSPDLIVTSSYRRAIDTARPTRNLFPSAHVREDWPIHEFNYLTSWSGGNSTIEDRRLYVATYWELSDPQYLDDPGSETFEQFVKRAQRVLTDLKNTAHETVSIFSHQQFICALLWLSQYDHIPMCPETMREYKDFLEATPVPNGAIVRVQLTGSQCRWKYSLITSHLKNLMPDFVAV